MRWWNRKPEERAQWELDPLVGVGPLRFGMSPDRVAAALDGAVAYVSQNTADRLSWQQYGDVGVTAIYGQGPRLVAVAVRALDGPQVRLRDVDLIARVPSEVRSDIQDLARREGVVVGVNWSGDPEVAAWGVSMGAALEWGQHPEGYAERRDAMITDALLVGPELAADPYGADPVIQWRDVRERDTNPGAWPVKIDQDRPRWDCTPLESVGPLRFGMLPQQVAAALDGEEPAVRQGHYPYFWRNEPGQWYLEEERFHRAGVSAHYWYAEGIPTLGAVTVHGRTGPQVAFAGIELIGRTLSTVDAALTDYIEEQQIHLLIGCAGDLGPDGSNMYVRAARAGDAVVSEARFCAEDWENHG
ncbi:hypothetical protein [Actinacidiphila glaucinigra]|uniref:hypothetical protein n=1 Tax=Actinacidiphila glaucinigra TaxID=235986 RepID=UPI0035D736FC